MVDYAIITIIDKNNVSLGDFELPLKVTVGELSKKMVHFLKAKDAQQYMYLSELNFAYKDRVLDRDETLYENAVWDGSYLKILF
ncbi:MAG: hypothetical protein IJZ53_03470 [Tyzzerella sp.]|nr:hypothetical protein [Tyzzerella sp.]